MTVQDAIDAANPGDKFSIGPGTYQSSAGYSVDKNLSIIGSGAPASTPQARAELC